MADGMRMCMSLRAESETLEAVFGRAFPRCEYSKPLFDLALRIWNSAPPVLVATFEKAGRSDDGLWVDLAAIVAPQSGSVIEIE